MMNREIKFRGRRIDNGEWVYGNYVFNKQFKEHQIVSFYKGIRQPKKVDPETVGQYTGLKDNNDKEIYEGDIMAYDFDDKYARGVVEIGIGEITHYTRDDHIDYKYQGVYLSGLWDHNEISELSKLIIIGKIYENKELLDNE